MNFNQTIRKRIFIVGVARSGTTLVQSMLASHPEIFSLPETHFFHYTIPVKKYKQIFKLYDTKNYRPIKEFFEQNYPNFQFKNDFTKTMSSKIWTGKIIKILDEFTIVNKQNIWLEKTPMHLYYIDLIQSVCPEAVFIHVLRPGKDVVASLYDVSHKYPESFGGPKSVKKCVQRWNREVNISLNYRNQNNHILVDFANLIKSPEPVLEEICEKMRLPFALEMLAYQKNVKSIRMADEKWKDNNSKPINKVDKFEKFFSHEEKKYINRKIIKMQQRVDEFFRKGKL